MAGDNGGNSRKYLSLVLAMYAIKLKSDTENQRCINDHVGHNTKSWPDIDCLTEPDMCRTRETEVPEECDIFCCNEQDVDFICHAVAYSMSKGMCRMYGFRMEDYDQVAKERGLVAKNGKGDDWMYFYRKWDSQLHDIINLTMKEESEDIKTFMRLDWMDVYKADWYIVDFEGENMEEKKVIPNIMSSEIEFNTRILPYNSRLNMSITAGNDKTNSAPHIVELLTRPPPIDNLTIIASDVDVDYSWKTVEGSESFTIKVIELETGAEIAASQETKDFNFNHAVKPVTGYQIFIHSNAIDFYGNATEGTTREMTFYSEFPKIKKVSIDAVDCDEVRFSWEDVGYGAKYKVQVYDLDNGQSVFLEDVDGTNARVTGLENARKYQTIVYAFDENTRGDPAEIVFISELCKAEDLFSPNQEDTAFELSWNPVVLAQKYKIKIEPSPADGLTSRYVQSAAAYIEALTPGIQYKVSITAIMKRTDKVEIISKEALLFQYTKLLAPEDLCIPNKNLHNSSATLTWTIMEGADLYYLALATCRPVNNFLIRPGFYRSKGQNCPRWRSEGVKKCEIKSDWDQGSKYLMQNISKNAVDKHEQIFQLTADSKMTLDGLEPGTIYMFWLGGVNKQTYSERAEMTFITRLKTTELAEFFDVTHDSVKVKWKLVNKADRYSIIVTHDIARRKRVQRLTTKSDSTDIIDLHPNSPYLIEVIAENKISFSWPFPLKMRTKLAPTKILSPFKPPRGDETGDDYFDIQWTPVEGAESYEIEITDDLDHDRKRREGDHSSDRPPFHLTHRVRPKNLEEHQFFAAGMNHNTEHEIKITAHNRFTDGSVTTERFFTRPHTPENFRTVEVYDDLVRVAWDACEGIWDYDINVYDDNNHVAKVVLHNKTEHEFKELIPNHHYIFVIRAYGHVVSHPATIKIFTKIQGVDYLTMTEVYDDTMKLDWKEANGASHYLVYFSHQEDPEERVERTETSDVTLTDLTPNSIYTIKVVGMNANTEGMPMFTTVITKLGYIKKLRQDIPASTDKTIMMRWLQVPNADHFILKVTSKRTNKRIQVHKIPAKDSSLLIRDLRPATIYVIEIQAFSDISDSYPTDFSPQTKITPIKGFSVDFTSDILLRLIWNSFTDNTYHIAGDGRYWKIDTNDFQWIPDLVADTNYNFTIWATKDIYYSDNTTLTALTHMSAPTVNVDSRTHTVIKISWTQVPRADQYRIQYVDTPTFKKIVDSGREKTFRMRYLLSEDQNIRVRNLDPYTEYLFFVRAERGQQIGENGTVTDYTRLSPTQAIEIKSRTDKTSQLSWASVNGAKGYTIKYQAQEPVQNEELSIYVEQTKEKLVNLLPGSTYKLVIIAEAPETSGQPANDEFDTFLEAPEQVTTKIYDTYTKTICWNPVFMAEGYTMNYASIEPEDKVSRAKDFTDFVEGSETCGYIDDLLPGLKYQISIWGWNQRYDGMKSKYKSATLLEAPEDFEVNFYNNTQIEVVFAPVTRALRYELAHAKINSSDWVIDGETSDLKFPINSLTPFTEYDIKINPINKVTRGYESKLAHWSKLNPISNFQRIKLTPNQVTLKWDPVEHAVKYRVFYVSEVSNLTLQETDYAGIIITGLEETTLYNISVEPVAENEVPGVMTLYPVITEAKTVEDLVIEDIEPWRMILTWTGTEKAIAYEVHVNSTEYSYIMRVRTNRAFIRQLEPGIKQNFKVYVITRISRSQPVPVAGFTTLPLPDSARVTKITHSKVMTKWNAALEDWAPAFDDLYYRCVLIKDYSNETVVNTTTTELGFDFTNLELNTRYTIILSSESPDTSSDERIIEIRTLLPDSPDLDMNEINDDNVVLTWNKTVGLNYAVYVKPLTCPADKVVICDIAETENVVVEGLVPACLYDLVIYGQICPKDRKLTIEDDRKRIANQMFYTKLESVTDIEIIEEDRIANFSWSRVPETSFYVIQWTSPELISENVTKTSEDERIVAQNLQPNTLYEGSIWGTNPDTKSNPAPFSLHTKMTRVNATLRQSGPDFLEYAWDKVNGAERYDFNGMPQFPGEDPFAKSTTSTSIKFDQLIDGSLYLIEAEAVNEDTTSVLSQYYVWTRLYEPDVVISNVEDTSLVLSVEHVDKATRIVGKINDAPIDFPLNSSESRTEIVLDNLEQGSMQSVKIQAVNDNCTSHFVEKNVMLLLTTPTNITVLPSADSVTLEWSAISKASNYLLTLTAENGEATQIEVRIPQYTFFGLSAGTLYKITIQAVNEETKSAEALIETYTRLDTLSQVDLIEIEPTSLSLEWNTVDGATGYEISVKQHYDQKLNLTESTLLFHTTNSSYQVTGLVPGAKYSYSVAGKNLNTLSDAEVFTIYTELENIPEVAAVQVHHNDMTVSWGFVPNAVEYVVELSDSAGRQIHSETVQAQETEWIANSIELKNLQPGAFYNVSLQAFNDVTKSNIAVLSHYTLLNPFNPRDVVIFEKRPEGIVFSWQPIAGADSYKIIIDKDFEFTYFMDRGEENPRELITNETSYDVTDLLPDTKYKYELIAFNQKTFSESFYGYEATLLPDIELAEVVEKTYASFKAQWSNVPGAADYLVQLRYTNGQVLFLTSLFKAEIDLRFGSLLPGVSYTLSIIGRNEITETRSKSLSVWTKLSPIINLRSNDDELQEDKVVLEWEDVPGTAHYHIVVLEVETDIVVFTENITESKYERRNLTAGTKYQFTIHAVNEFTESDTEQIAVATPLSKPTDYQISVFHPYLIKGSWKLGDALAPRHRRITWRCGTDDPKYCDCSDFEGCPGHYVLKKIRADGEKSWTPEMLGGGDVIEDSIQLDNDMVYRMCIRAENPQTGENSRPFCVTLKTGMIAEEAAEDQKLCIQRDVNWINPLEMIPAILNNGEWTYEQTPKGVIPSYNSDLTATCKKIGKVYSWDLKDFIRIHQKSCSPGWISIDNDFPGEVVQCLFPKHKSGTPIFPKSMIEVNYCEKRSVDPKRPWIALRNVANGGRCGCHYLKACERWDYKPFPGFTVRNAAPIITMPLVKNEQACLKKCDVQRERECAKIPQVVKEGKTNCVCKNCCLMTTLSTEDGCVLFTSSLNRTSTRIEARDQTTVFTNFLGAQGSPGFRLLDFTNNGVARPEMDYELTLSFSYASETCVRIIFDQNNVTEAVYHDIIIRKGRDYSKSKPCMETYPTLSFYPVEHVIDYDLEEGETIKIVETYSYSDYGIYDSIVEITSTDDDQAGDNIVKDQMIQKKIGINQFGCQYPAIKIEGPWLADETKTITLPKSKKLILSATSDIQCEVNPGYSFRWTAKLIGFDHSFDNMVIDGNMTLEDHLELIEESSGDVENLEGSGGYIELVLAEKLEAALQPRDLVEGLWKVTIELEFNDLDFLVEDVVWINVIPSPLEIDIEGGEKRTAGHGKTIQFKADAVDPDESSSDQTKGIEFGWFILGTNATETIPIDAYFEELYANQSLLPYHWEDKPTEERKFDLSDMYQVRSKSEVWINTDFFYMNEPFKVILVCSKDIREAIFEQTVTAVAGDPPDFFIKCVENCKDKLNRGEVLSLMIKCKNCVRGRSPRFFWSFSLYDLPEEEEEDEYSSYDEPDEPGSVIVDDVPSMTATFNQRIMKVHKNYFLPGREYSIDVSVSMDGYDEELDQIVRQEASNQIVRKVNLPPINGHCIGIGGESTCDYITQEQYELVPNENATVIFTEDIPEAECSEACCFGEAINCLGYQFTAAINETNGNCTLFDIPEDDENVELLYVPEDAYFSRYNRRVFAKVEAVKGEVSFQCQDWFDEGTFLNYEEAAGRQPQLMYRFTTKPINESIDPFLLYHGPSPQTPKLSLPLGNKDFFFFGLRVVAEICDLYGECVDSNEILVQSFPMISVDVGGDLMNAVSGNSSKLLTAVSTKNPKIVASITGAVSSYFVQNISDISSDTLITTTAALTTVAATTRRLIFANNMPTPNPIVEGQPEEPLFDLSQVVARPVETDGIAAEEDSEEIAKQKAEEAERVRQWTIQMAAEASNFLSSGSLETQSSLSRRKRQVRDFIRKRARRSADYFYDEYQGGSDNSSDYEMYEFSGISEQLYGPTESPIYVTTMSAYEDDLSLEVESSVKKGLKKELMNAMGSIVDVIVSPESLMQVSAAVSTFTETGDDLEDETQQKGADMAVSMTSNLKGFTEEANKEQLSKIGGKVMASLSGIVSTSTPDDQVLKEDKLAGKEPNFDQMEKRDINPIENEWMRKLARLENRKNIAEKAPAAKNITSKSLGSVSDLTGALTTKQMGGEEATEVESGDLSVNTQKISAEDASGARLRNKNGVSIKLPEISEATTAALLEQGQEELDIQMSTFGKNPFKYDDDASLVNSAVTVLNMPNGTDDILKSGMGLAIPNDFSADNQMMELHFPDEGVLQVSRFEIVGPGNAILMVYEPPHLEDTTVHYEVFIRNGSAPVLGSTQDEHIFDFKFSLPLNLEIWEMENPAIDKYKVFIPENDIECEVYPCSWFVGSMYTTSNMTTPQQNRRKRRSPDLPDTTHHLFLSTPGCRVLNQETGKWSSNGCHVDSRSTPEYTECFCKDLPQKAIFSAEFFVPPNKIDFSTIWSKFCITCNAGVFSFVIVFLALWLIAAWFILRMDKNDAIKWALRSLIDNRREDKVLYQISVTTGGGGDSSTKSKIYFRLEGMRKRSRVRRLGTTKNAQLFERGTNKHFLMREAVDLGELKALQIWHDNSGRGALKGWYCQQVVVTHVQSNKRWFFMIQDYLDAARSDGKCERLVPPADPDEKQNFNKLFAATSWSKLSDDHIWLSTFHRPTKSIFKRMERWSCCACLTFITMLTNMMFAGQEDSSEMIRIGPFRFSPSAIYISAICSLIVVPATLIPITLFKKRKSKANDGTDNRAKGFLPWWSKYVAYGLNFCVTIICAFFVILYSMDFGKAKSDKWLLNELMSFCVNIVVAEPIKVVLISMFIASILRKLDQSFLDLIENTEIEQEDKRFLDLCCIEDDSGEAPLITPAPPNENDLNAAKELRYKEEKMVEIIWDIIAYFIYICIVIFLATGNRDPMAFAQNENIKNMLYYDKFEKVESVDDFWNWINSSVRDSIYPTHAYNGRKLNWRERAFMEDGASFRVGPARIRLQRGDPWSCRMYDEETDFPGSPEPRKRCDHGDEIKGNYDTGWHNEIDASTVDVDDIFEQAWIYRSWKELNGAPFQGDIGIYNGGGYSAELGVNPETCSAIVKYLYQNAFISHTASASFVEFTIYNTASNLFSKVQFVSEWLPSGNSVNNFKIDTFRLYHYEGTVGSMMVVAHIFFIAHMIFKIVSTIKDGFCKFGFWGVVKDNWKLFEVIMILLDILILIFYSVRMMVSDKLIDLFKDDKRSFVNFDPVVAADSTLGWIISFAVFFSILKFGKLLRFNQRIEMLSSVIKKIGQEWSGFFVMFMTVLMSFLSMAMIMWNKYSSYFSNIIRGSETLLDGMLGGLLYKTLTERYPVFGAWYYLFFCFTMMFLILNVLVAIINTSCELGSEELLNKSNEFEIMEFMMKSFKTKISWLSGEQADPEVDDATAEVQLRVEKLKSSRINRLQKQEAEAMSTFEKSMKALKRLDNVNFERSLGINPEMKYKASTLRRRPSK